VEEIENGGGKCESNSNGEEESEENIGIRPSYSKSKTPHVMTTCGAPKTFLARDLCGDLLFPLAPNLGQRHRNIFELLRY
jgi:hypothetical protein